MIYYLPIEQNKNVQEDMDPDPAGSVIKASADLDPDLKEIFTDPQHSWLPMTSPKAVYLCNKKTTVIIHPTRRGSALVVLIAQ